MSVLNNDTIAVTFKLMLVWLELVFPSLSVFTNHFRVAITYLAMKKNLTSTEVCRIRRKKAETSIWSKSKLYINFDIDGLLRSKKNGSFYLFTNKNVGENTELWMYMKAMIGRLKV